MTGRSLPWPGAFVASALDVTIVDDPTRGLVPVRALVGMALRRNPRRAHLLVSTVLAKHVPTDPGLAIAAGRVLGLAVADAIDGRLGGPGVAPADRSPALVLAATHLLAALDGNDPAPALRGVLDTVRPPARPDVVTIGFAETATGLGRLVAGYLGARTIHSTRLAPAGAIALTGFEEAHSHATDHRLLPLGPLLTPGGTVVLVDDELSTGATAVNTIRALHAIAPQALWVVAALVDLRGPADRARLDALAEELGTVIEVVALGAGTLTLPEDVLERAPGVVDALEGVPGAAPAAGHAAGDVVVVRADAAPVRSERFGAVGDVDAGVAGAVAESVAALLGGRPGVADVLVLGTEEHMALPLAAADALDALLPDARVLFSTTTRSPIVASDRDDYAVRSVAGFRSHDTTLDGPGRRFVYNLVPRARIRDVIVVVPEPGTDPASLDGDDGLLAVLRRHARLVVVALVPEDLPTPDEWARALHGQHALPDPLALPEPLVGPAFGSYAADEVLWLLQDLGDVDLEAPAADRERAMQEGTANYAESLPVEYQPSAEYQALYQQALERSARRVAVAVGVVTEQVLRARGNAPVLVSLARAGTPIGILMRRWAAAVHGIDAPHHTMSIVRGVGIDTVALRWLAAHHDPARIVFVDGWTGKGAIARELDAALDAFAASDRITFPKELAVLADPGHCTTLFGTRDDYLIPSACLNSTVSGLVSRTVYSRALIAPDAFHGAKFYRDLADADVSGAFLDAVSAWFDDVRDDVARALADLDAADRTPTWAGWDAVARVAARYGIDDLNLVKPGVGETTRVLLRRVPERILVRPGAEADVAHVLLLAEQRGVEVVAVPGLPYSCMGLIHPLGARATTVLPATAVPASALPESAVPASALPESAVPASAVPVSSVPGESAS